LLQRLDRVLGTVEDRRLADRDVWYQKAFDVLRTPELRGAFDLSVEPAALLERYGPHLFGQGCLLARRLLEAGVSLVTVYWHYEGPEDSPVWDTHQNNFDHLRKRLIPPTDPALAALLDDLSQRGLLDDTLVVCMGEFGRTPRINAHAGRDHWGPAGSILFAGAGVAAGRVYGATDRHGAYPVENAVTPADVTATILHLLGVPEGLEIQDRTGRRFPACTGSSIAGVLV
jgi:arylsulfatase A-like enzyme